MTYKQGFGIGLVIGFVCWLISSGYLVFTLAPALLRFTVILVAVIMFILSIAVGIVSIVKRSAVFGTTGDGAIWLYRSV